MPDDQQLLRRYAADGSEAAFGELVARYVNLVYSAALRRAGGDAHLAQDVAQLVFTDLARKARSLPPGVVLAGWLHRASRYAAAQLLRTERRRQAREQEAVAMNALQSEPASDWDQIRPLLDEALDRLDRLDRDALLLRFFEQLSLADVGHALGANEDAARKRVSRALEKLRADLIRCGVKTTAAALSAAVAANALQVAPAGLAAALTSASLASAAAGTGTTLTLLKLMTMTKLKAGIIGAIVVAGVATPLVIQQHQAQAILRAENESLRQQVAEVKAERARPANPVTQETGSQTLPSEQFNELLRLRGEVTRLRADSRELAQLKTASALRASDPMEPAAKALLNKVNLLKQRLEQMPDKKIPELQYLDEETWLRIAQTARLEADADVRQALSSLRDIAKQLFAPMMGKALRDYTQANNGQLPTDLSQLKPYFDSRVDDATLQRYQVLKTGNVSDLQPNDMVLAEKAPVDDQYDNLFQIGLNSRNSQGTGKNSGNTGMGTWSSGTSQGQAVGK
jgi:RNA polymerase sigma factor (sigma-70 family)